MKIPFKYYMHDNDSFYESFRDTFEDTPLADLSDAEVDALLQKVGNPFYELKFDCVLDTETGEVEIVVITP